MGNQSLVLGNPPNFFPKLDPSTAEYERMDCSTCSHRRRPESASIDALSKRMDCLLRKMEEAHARMGTTPKTVASTAWFVGVLDFVIFTGVPNSTCCTNLLSPGSSPILKHGIDALRSDLGSGRRIGALRSDLGAGRRHRRVGFFAYNRGRHDDQRCLHQLAFADGFGQGRHGHRLFCYL